MILRDWPFDPAWEGSCVQALRAAIPDGWAVLWLDFNRPPDGVSRGYSEIAGRMVAALADARTHVIWEGERFDEAATLLAQCQACIAMRLHGVLLACTAAVPVVAIEYDGKVAALCDEIGVPPQQRISLPAIGHALPAALASVVASGASSSLTPAHAANLGERALAHRELLWRAMAAARGAPPSTHCAIRGQSWLARWVTHSPDLAPRIVAGLTARLRRKRSLPTTSAAGTAVRP
jgi:hypothetical protein